MKTIKIFKILIITMGFFTLLFIASGKAQAASSIEIKTINTIKNSGNIAFNVCLTNKTSSNISLNRIKFRYYFTIDTFSTQGFYCDYTSIGNTNLVNGVVVKLKTISDKADYYVQISFTSTDVITANSTIYLNCRMTKSIGNYTNTNDYSYIYSSTYVNNQNIPGYLDDVLNWGTEPVLTIDVPYISIKLQMYNSFTASPSNTIGFNIKIINNGYYDVDMSKVNIYYYFTVNGEEDQNFVCDWSEFGKSNVYGVFEKINSEKADYRVKIMFKPEAGTLIAGEEKELYCRIHKINWTLYQMNDDYSYKDVYQSIYTDWNMVVCKINGIEYWGIDPIKTVAKIANIMYHKSRIIDNTYELGGGISASLKFQLNKTISNPVIKITSSIKKQDGNNTGFLLKNIKRDDSIDKRYFKVYKNDIQINPTKIGINFSATGINISINESFVSLDTIRVDYWARLSATNTVINTGVKKYLTNNNLNKVLVNVFFELLEWKENNALVTNPYSYSTAPVDEKSKFIMNIKITDDKDFWLE